MRMDPDIYYYAFVLPNYEDFCENEHDIRKGFNAVLSASHMSDNYYYYYRAKKVDNVLSFKKIADFKAHLATIEPYFNDIHSIANAFKHLYIDSKKAHVVVESEGVVTSIRIQGNNIVDVIGCKVNDCGKVVIIYKRKDGAILRLKEALSYVIKIWQEILDRDSQIRRHN